MSGFCQGATYKEIQAWVQENYGFHVTHLNIAKTKRKCRIIERQNYNLPKNKDSRSPGTPKEKEDAVIEAFRHFRMIREGIYPCLLDGKRRLFIFFSTSTIKLKASPLLSSGDALKAENHNLNHCKASYRNQCNFPALFS